MDRGPETVIGSDPVTGTGIFTAAATTGTGPTTASIPGTGTTTGSTAASATAAVGVQSTPPPAPADRSGGLGFISPPPRTPVSDEPGPAHDAAASSDTAASAMELSPAGEGSLVFPKYLLLAFVWLCEL